MVQFLERFTDYPFLVKFKNSKYPIREGEPTFTVNFKETIPLAELLKSTSLALGEAYMRGDLDIEGNLYEALDHFLGQMSKFSTNESALKKIMFSSTSKKNQEKEVTSHYDIGNDFYKLWLDETMSYSCGYFIHDDDSLYQAQVNKVDYLQVNDVTLCIHGVFPKSYIHILIVDFQEVPEFDIHTLALLLKEVSLPLFYFTFGSESSFLFSLLVALPVFIIDLNFPVLSFFVNTHC